MVKIYTKGGDGGRTSLFGGVRVGKDSIRLSAYGTVDELNSQIGVVIGFSPPADILEKLLRVQSELFVLGTDLATPLETGSRLKNLDSRIVRITPSYIKRLEKEIDLWEKRLTPIKNFILPGGCLVGAGLHLARTIARRAERATVSLSAVEKINANSLVYLNRLSDWLFVAARLANHLEKIGEVYWRGK